MNKIGRAITYVAFAGAGYLIGAKSDKHEQYKVFDKDQTTYVMDKQMNISFPIQTIGEGIYMGSASHNLKGAFVLTGKDISEAGSKGSQAVKNGYQSLEEKANGMYDSIKEKFQGE